MTPILTLAAILPSLRTQPLLTGSSNTVFTSLPKHSMLESLVLPTIYWLRFEWQHRGSPHVLGIAWLSQASSVEEVLAQHQDSSKEDLIHFIDTIVTTINPAAQPDGSNVDNAPAPKTNPHICNQTYADVHDFNQDLADLIATCQRHTRCSAAYCLRTRDGKQQCRFGFPKLLQPGTALVIEDEQPLLLTAWNDGFINSYNPAQLSAWRANVDMQYCVSRHKVIQYHAQETAITKY